jgi:hypothetical protein
MLRVLGSSGLDGTGLKRRTLLQAGVLGSAAPLALAAQTAETATFPHFGRAKRVLFLYLYGAAAQHETFDPKPAAAAEIRGDLAPIDTAVPGLQVCEHLPRLATALSRATVIRSMTHPYNIHSAAYTMTGVDKVDIPMELGPYDNRHWPSFGSVVDYLHQRQQPLAPLPEIPRNIALPFPFSSRAPEFQRAGPYGGFLGQAYNPVWTEFTGAAPQHVNRWRGDRDNSIADPFLAVSPDTQFTVSAAAQLRSDVTLDRLDRRRDLLTQLDEGRRQWDRSLSTAGVDRFQKMAYSLLTSQQLRAALDIHREPQPLRERYGMTLFGQAALAGRRLLEAGAQVVTVIWDEFGPANTAWDTHFDHYERLKTELLPGLDQALSAVLIDLDDRGLLDETLVLCLTEHGRTPRLTLGARGVGREHWSETYCNVLAGAGIARGRVVGQSDADGAFVKDGPISPKDVLCTVYHLLGHDPHTLIPDRLGRPLPLVSHGRVLSEVLA